MALPFSQAVANESGLNFISVKGPELLNMVCANHGGFCYLWNTCPKCGASNIPNNYTTGTGAAEVALFNLS